MMQQNGTSDAGGQPGSSAGAGGRIDREKQDARTAAHEVRDDVTSKAERLAADAKAAAGEKIEETQHGIGAGLKSIGGAFRAAGEHLSSENQKTASRMANEAAGGIDRLSESLQNRSLDEIVGDLRTFGRNNAGGLFAGSLIAGLAFGRLMKLSVKSDSSGDASDRTSDHASSDASSTAGGSTGARATGPSAGSRVAGSTGANTAGSSGSGPVGASVSDPARPAFGREPTAGGVTGKPVSPVGTNPSHTGTGSAT